MSRAYQQADSEEQLQLHGHVESSPVITNVQNQSSIFLKTLCFIGVCALAFLGLSGASNTLNFPSSLLKSNSKVHDMESSDVSISIEIFSPDYGTISAISYLPWDYVAEPYKTQIANVTDMTIDGDHVDLSSSDYLVQWSFNGTQYTGGAVEFQLNFTGVIDVHIKIHDKIHSKYYTDTHLLAVKYVRREIRTMTDTERDTYLDALQLVYTLSDEEGQKLYGSKFKSSEGLLYKHLNGAGTTDCDHWHDGAGLITHHAAFTLEAEQSLQAINPAISMPYWEYPVDGYLYDDYNWVESPIFTDTWFSTASPTTSDHYIDSGRWAYLQVPNGTSYSDWSISESGTLNPFVNAYSSMRSPWNNNPTSYIGRYNYTYGKISNLGRPTCETMSSCYSSDTLAEMNDCMNGNTHGPVHVLIGGSWDYGDIFSESSESGVGFLQSTLKLLLFKMLWRYGWSRCPSTCDDYENRCTCSVPSEYLSTYGAYHILNSAGVLNALDTIINTTSTDDDSDDLYMKILLAVEDPGVVGEMFTSAAPADPTFWPLHGSIERLVGLKRTAIASGLISTSDFDETWGYTTSNYLYLVGTCDWSAVSSSDDLTLPTCNMSTAAICPGHHAYDTLEFSNFQGNGETYTNMELYEFIHPWNEALPYTYDSYDFDYCYDYYPDDSFSFDSVEYDTSVKPSKSKKSKKSSTK